MNFFITLLILFSRKPVICDSVRKGIFNVFRVSTWLDAPDQYASKICEKCARKNQTLQFWKYYDVNNIGHHQTVQTEWLKHSRTGKCVVCDTVKNQAKGGGSHKRKVQIQTTSSYFDPSVSNIFDHLPSQTCTVPPNIDIIVIKGKNFCLYV